MAKQITAATVAVRLTAITGPLQKGLKTATSSVQSFAKGFIGLKSAVAGALGVGGVGLAIKNSLDYIDSLSKSAVKFGTTTKAFAGLQHAANLSGVEIGSLATAVKTMQKSINEAASTGKDDGGIFAAMGLSPSQLSGMDPVQALAKVADGLGKFQNSAARTAATVQLFGRSGAELIPLFIGGGAAIREAAADAEKLGLAIDDVSAIKVEAANDAWTRFKSSLTGVGNAVAVEIAPAMKVLGDMFTDLFIKIRVAIPSLRDVFLGLASSIKAAVAQMEGVRRMLQGMAEDAAVVLVGLVNKFLPEESNRGAKGYWVPSGGRGLAGGAGLRGLNGSEVSSQVQRMRDEIRDSMRSDIASLDVNGVGPVESWTNWTNAADAAAEEAERIRKAFRQNSMTIEDNTAATARSTAASARYSGLSPGAARGSIEAVNAINRHMGGGQAQQQTKLLSKIEQGIAAMKRGIDDLRPIDVAFS